MTELTAETINKLSPGAAKLYLAYLFEPGATDGQARNITGYKSRWFKKLRNELMEAGLLASEAEELSAEAQRCEAELRSVGVDTAGAHNLARACPPEMVQSAVAYVRGRRDIANPAGYVVRSLREKLKTSKESGAIHGNTMPNFSRNIPFRSDIQKGQDSPGAAQNFSLEELRHGDLQANADPSKVYAVERRESKPNSNNVAPGRSYRRFAQDAQTSPLTLDGALLDTEFQLLLFTLQATCGCDPVLNPADLDDAYRLYCAQYRAPHIERFVCEVWPQCWPGNKGERLTMPWLLKLIGFTRSHGMPVPRGDLAQDTSTPTGDNVYLADPYFADRGEEGVQECCERCGQVECVCTAIPAQVENTWRAASEALRAQFRDGDHRLSLSYVSPVAYNNGVLLLRVPRRVKDWFESKVLPTLRVWCRDRQDGKIEIALLVDCDLADSHAICSDCGHHPCRCREIAIPIRVRTMWQATVGQLQIQLKRSTYDTWLRHAHLVAFEDNQVKVEVPHDYAKDWIDRHLLPSLTRSFNEMYRGEQAVAIVVEIAPRDDGEVDYATTS